MGWGKMARWSTKATISLKRVKIEEKLLRMASRNSPTLFRTLPPPTPYGLPFPNIGGSQPQTAIAIISGTGKATNCKSGRCIHRVHANISPWKIWEERGVSVSLIFGVPPIISGLGKATNFKFCTYIHKIDRNKSPLKISAKVAVGALRDSRKFRGHPYIKRIARSSLR